MIGDGVRTRVAGPQASGKRFASRVGEGQHRVEREAVLVGRRAGSAAIRLAPRRSNR
jgi:hypothetical protein